MIVPFSDILNRRRNNRLLNVRIDAEKIKKYMYKIRMRPDN